MALYNRGKEIEEISCMPITKQEAQKLEVVYRKVYELQKEIRRRYERCGASKEQIDAASYVDEDNPVFWLIDAQMALGEAIGKKDKLRGD